MLLIRGGSCHGLDAPLEPGVAVAGNEVPEAVRQLLREHVNGFEQLEILLLAVRDPGKSWTAEAVAAELRIDARVVEEALDELHDRGLFARGLAPRSYVYRPSSPSLDQAVRELVRIHGEDRLALMEVMCATALERLRTMTLRKFADAFRLRRPKDDG